MPVFVAGKLLGFRRKRNDALLMFCLRHYGQDANGKRTTINYFSSRASAGAVATNNPGSNPSPEGEGLSVAEASTTTVRTVITDPGAGGDPAARGDEAATVLDGFEGVALDVEAEAAIAAALEACAARARAALAAYDKGGAAAADAAEDDPGQSFFRSEDYHGELLPPCASEDFVPFGGDEGHWSQAGEEMPQWAAKFADEQEAKGATRE